MYVLEFMSLFRRTFFPALADRRLLSAFLSLKSTPSKSANLSLPVPPSEVVYVHDPKALRDGRHLGQNY
jgi:hypothetical protein